MYIHKQKENKDKIHINIRATVKFPWTLSDSLLYCRAFTIEL